MIIGLTGGIASGKSTVSKLLVEQGALLVDADQVARLVVEPGQAAYEQIIAQFGQVVLNDDGTINRQELGKIVFSDKAKLKQLESITHPAIRSYMLSQFTYLQKTYPNKIIIADIPLLFETKQEHLYEGVIVVYVDPNTQLSRLMERNNLTEAEAKQRMALQMSLEEKKDRATWVIDNSGTLEQTKAQIMSFMAERNLQ